MRIIVNNEEFYIFRNKTFKRSTYYYNNKTTTLADKYFTTSLFRISERKRTLVDILSSSPSIPELLEAPKEISVSLEDQLEDLLSYLKNDFNIFMDERNRFYTIKNAETKMFQSTPRKLKYFFSWDEIIQIYNTPHSFFERTFNNNIYIKNKYKNLNKLTKKYVYINLKKMKSKGFAVDSNIVVSLPI